MKNRIILMLATVALLGANDAFASRAKLLVMGTGEDGTWLDVSGNGGSFFYDTPYDMFYNPAMINNYNNWAIVERSNFVSDVSVDPDRGKRVHSTTTVNGQPEVALGAYTRNIGSTAMGGFITSFWKFRIGMFFNRVAAVDAYYENRNLMKPIDLIIGGDQGSWKWGFGLTYANAKTDRDLNLRLGATWRDFEPFLQYKLIGSETLPAVDGSAGVERDYSYGDMRAGLRYNYGEWRPVIAWKKTNAGSRIGGIMTTSWGLGLGRSMRVAEGIKVLYSIGYWRTNASHRRVVPLYVSAEGDVAKWLTLRGGVTYRFVDQSDITSDRTTGRFGASINVSGASLDMAIGKTVADATETDAALDSQNFDFANGLFSSASLSYKW